VPDGVPPTDCALLTFNSNLGGDLDLNDFRHVVPGMKVVDCRSTDCVATPATDPCVYYVRSAGCYYHPGGVPAVCATSGETEAGDHLLCLSEPSASFERSAGLEPIEVRTIDIVPTFPDRHAHYPQRAQVGLFRVRPKQ
jgi:hypothetical protein